jgi:hypothetical protein
MTSYTDTDFGQIAIYDELFAATTTRPELTPTECIERKLSYCGKMGGKRVPIMIGSTLWHQDDNPLGLYGYFIIDGICKSVSSMYIYNKVMYTQDRAYLSFGRVSILSMGKYEIHVSKSRKKWYLPINYDEIYRYSVDSMRLKTHLDIIAEHMDDNQFSERISPPDAYILCQMFEYNIGIKSNYVPMRRLVTPGELIHDALMFGYDVVKFFRTHTWTVKHILNVTSVSEDMKHYSIMADIEAVRRVTFPTVREVARMQDRYVKDFEKNIFCPVQTSDGVLCGTIMYLALGATVSTKDSYAVNDVQQRKRTHSAELSDFRMLFVNGDFINYCREVTPITTTLTTRSDKHAIMVWTDYGRIIPSSTSSISHVVSYIPFRTYNPAVRAMFGASIIKQAITKDTRIIDGMFGDTKYMLNGEQPLVGQPFPYAAGWNLNVAVMPWFGYNVEDAIVISESTAAKFEYEKISIYSSQLTSRFDRIVECKIKVGDNVRANDILFTVYHPSEITTLESVRAKIDGTITRIVHNSHCFSVKVNTRKILKVGDKMSSRHGQKGIISLILPDHKMPYFKDNDGNLSTVDLIMNPHTFPSRKTMGQLKEMAEDSDRELLREMFIEDPSPAPCQGGAKLSRRIESKIIAGKCFYMALRHQVDDKVQYRNIGSLNDTTRQAISGKSRNGGLRIGHMERDILVAVGAHRELEYFYSIDKTQISCCNTCGLIAMVNKMDACPHERYNVPCHQHLIVCVSMLRANGHDIRYYPALSEYKIIPFDVSKLPEVHNADELYFGYSDYFDIRQYCGVAVIPTILRVGQIDHHYKRMFNRRKHDDIKKALKKLLTTKRGYYHELVEGHRIDHCVRSVIVPNPTLPVDVVEIPFGCDIGKTYGILNRQPSLSENSMMAVTLRVGENKTIGINPLLCTAFNADFDGDEMCIYGIDWLCEKLPVKCEPVQDYIHSDDMHAFTMRGLTCSKDGILEMITVGAKGKPTDYAHIYEKVGDVIVNGEVIGTIDSCYSKGLSEDEWYLQARAAREGASSIGINTPFIGDLNSTSNKLII